MTDVNILWWIVNWKLSIIKKMQMILSLQLEYVIQCNLKSKETEQDQTNSHRTTFTPNCTRQNSCSWTEDQWMFQPLNITLSKYLATLHPDSHRPSHPWKPGLLVSHITWPEPSPADRLFQHSLRWNLLIVEIKKSMQKTCLLLKYYFFKWHVSVE